KMLNRVHETFTADELLEVELVLQNPEAMTPKAPAGRARLLDGRPDRLGPRASTLAGGTIACVTGFLVNMVERTIRLITPTRTCEQWPLGYRTAGLRRFRTPADFRHGIEELIDTCIPVRPGDLGH